MINMELLLKKLYTLMDKKQNFILLNILLILLLIVTLETRKSSRNIYSIQINNNQTNI